MSAWKHIQPENLGENPFKLIGSDWSILTAGVHDDFNAMTVSWGGLGALWNMDVATVYVRPERYTFEFINRYEMFTLSFFDERYREALNFIGTHSGRDSDKLRQTGLNPETTPHKGVAFSEARLILECRKLYFQDLNPDNFLDPSIRELYPLSDYHRMFVGEVVNCLTK